MKFVPNNQISHGTQRFVYTPFCYGHTLSHSSESCFGESVGYKGRSGCPSKNNETNAFANSFTPMTSRDWNSYPSFQRHITLKLSRSVSRATFNSDLVPEISFTPSSFNSGEIHSELQELYIFILETIWIWHKKCGIIQMKVKMFFLK